MFYGKSITVIIPTLNEEENLPVVLGTLPDFIDEIIIVDGYSKDNTAKIAEDKGLTVLFDDKGKGSALRIGMNEGKGDIIIMMDADCSHLSSELILLIAGIEAGYDICMGSRFIQGGGSEDISLIRKFGNWMFVKMVNTLWRTNYSDLCYGYRSFRREVIKDLELTEDGFGIETEISIKAAKNKLRTLEVPSFEKARKSGVGKLGTISDGWRILKRIIMEVL